MFLLLILLLHGTVQCAQKVRPFVQNSTDKRFIYDIYKYDSRIKVTVNNSTEHILDFYEKSDQLVGYPTRVHVSVNNTVNTEYPVFITATQQKGVSSWELPLVVSTAHSTILFEDMARTLCPHDATSRDIFSVNRPQIQVSTYSPADVMVDIKLKRVQDFYVEVDKEVTVSSSPSTPKYYYFSFDSDPPSNHTNVTKHGFLPRFNYTIPKSVVLMIESDEDVCAIVSIQNNSCPVFDNEKDVLYQGYHLTMTTKGGITLTQSMFPRGFYVVFIVKETDDECVLDDVPPPVGSPRDRLKNFRFRIVATISYKEYVVGAVVTLSVLLLCAALVPLVALPATRWAREKEVVIEETSAPGPSTSREEAPATTQDELSDDDDACLLAPAPAWAGSLPPLTVASLSRARTAAHYRRSNRYFWSALTVAVVYALPVVQLLLTYQQMVFQTGDQDLCYYNFLCAHPLGELSDFNHVFSNLGYCLLGLAFMAQVSARSARDTLPTAQGLGIPRHPGLLYSLGLALVMEGLLSASYHLCPNKMNFQFDSSFMYVIAVLCMVKLYQGRHPDVNASAHATFMLLAVLITIGLFGIMYPSVYFWSVFTVLHLATCFILTLNIYYVGQLKLDRSIVGRAWAGLCRERWQAFKPNYVARAVLLALANLANWALASYGLYMHNKDFARHLLAILMGNAILYLWFYIAMKLIHRERVPPHSWLYLVAAHGAWFFALHLFLRGNTKWSETPAHSRRHNAPCTALQFYDSHDLWHVTSALALFLSFNVLLTVDDELRLVPRENIPVF